MVQQAVTSSRTSNIVVVPDLSADELTATAKHALRLTYFHSLYEQWDYYTDLSGKPILGRGLKFETIIVLKTEIKSGIVSWTYARDHLRELGFFGHVGAFTQWRRQNPTPTGFHASIPEDRACLRDHHGNLCAPYSYINGEDRRLDIMWLGHRLNDGESVVGFREVSA